jgi:hypothetical protein
MCIFFHFADFFISLIASSIFFLFSSSSPSFIKSPNHFIVGIPRLFSISFLPFFIFALISLACHPDFSTTSLFSHFCLIASVSAFLASKLSPKTKIVSGLSLIISLVIVESFFSSSFSFVLFSVFSSFLSISCFVLFVSFVSFESGFCSQSLFLQPD